jgi:hypothetical protein
MFSGMMPGRRPMSGLPGKQKKHDDSCVRWSIVLQGFVNALFKVKCCVRWCVTALLTRWSGWAMKRMPLVVVVLMGADGSRNGGGGDDDMMLMVVALWWMVVGTVVAMNVTMMVI